MSYRKERARAWVNNYSVLGAGIVMAAVFPGSTALALATMETHMCYEIGKIYRGGVYSMEEAAAAAAAVGIAVIAGPIIALEALTWIPFAGWAAKGAAAGAVIKALGEAIIHHYESTQSGGGSQAA